MSIEQEINRNTMTIAELVKAVRDLTEAIKGAGTAAAKAGTAVADFARLAATHSVTIDTDRVGEVSSTKTTIEPDHRPFTEVVAEHVATSPEFQNLPKEPSEISIEQGSFYWSHPESGSYGMVKTLAELNATLEADGCCQEVSAEQYLQLVADEIAPTEPLNGLQARAGVEEINAEQYAVLKAEYTKLTDQVIAGNAKTAPAAATAVPVATPPSAPAAAAPSPTGTNSEPPPSAPEPAASPAEPATVAEPTWPEVHATLMRLVKTAGCGAPQLIALLEDFGVKRPETALALQTKAVGRFAEIIANAERRMKGGAA